MELNKRILITGAFLFVFAVILDIILISLNNSKPISNSPSSISLPSPTKTMNSSPLIIDPSNSKKLLNLLENRQQLSAQDNSVKQKLMSLSSNGEPQIYTSSDFSVFYVQPADEFQVEILTTDINKAKGEAVSWFVQQGMSTQGICQLPLNFFVSSNIIQSLNAQNKTVDFNQLPDGC